MTSPHLLFVLCVKMLKQNLFFFFTVPVPGGCNQVFDLEIDPNIRLTSFVYHTQVWFQWANVGGRRGGQPQSCEKKDVVKRLSYEVYVGYVSENDDGMDALLEVVGSMMTVQQIQSNSQKVSQLFFSFFLSQVCQTMICLR